MKKILVAIVFLVSSNIFASGFELAPDECLTQARIADRCRLRTQHEEEDPNDAKTTLLACEIVRLNNEINELKRFPVSYCGIQFKEKDYFRDEDKCSAYEKKVLERKQKLDALKQEAQVPAFCESN